MKKFWSYLWLLSCLLEIVLGIYCIINPEIAVGTIALLIGVVIMIHGITTLIQYFTIKIGLLGSTWYLLDGILSLIVGIMFTFTDFYYSVVSFIPIILSIWMILKGIFVTIEAIDVKKIGFDGWLPHMIVGIAVLVLGICTFNNPMIGDKIIGIVMCIYFIISGLIGTYQWYIEKKLIDDNIIDIKI